MHERGVLVDYCTQVLERYMRMHPLKQPLTRGEVTSDRLRRYWESLMAHDNCGCSRNTHKVA